MRIKHLDIAHFGKFHDKQMELAPGINVIYGQNEAGKSTVHSFIGCMFFGAERLRGRGAGKDNYTRFQPWEGSGAYSGSMSFLYKGRSYRIIRDFQKDSMQSLIIDEETGQTVAEGSDAISEVIPGFTREKYRNTISAGQVSMKTDESFAAGMRSYLANLSMSASEEVDIDKALWYLKSKKSKVNARISDGSDSEAESRAESLRQEVAQEESLREELDRLENEGREQEQQIAALQKEYDEVVREDQNARAAAIRLIQENNDIAVQYREKKAALSRKMKTAIRADENTIRTAIVEYQNRQQRITDLKYRLAGAQAEMDGSAFRALAFSLPVAALALFVWLLGGNVGIPAKARQILALIIGAVAVMIFIVSLLSAIGKRGKTRRLEAELVPLEKAQQDLLMRFGVSSIQDLQQGAASAASDLREEQRMRRELAQLRERYNSLQEPLRPYLERYGESLSLDSDAGTEQLEKISALQEQLQENRKKCSQIEWQLEQIAERRQQLEMLDEQLLEKKNAKKEDLEKLQAIELSLRTIREITSEIHGSFGTDLNEEVSRLFSLISDGEHGRILLDDKFHLLVDDGGKPVPVSQMSAGTEDQIYFSVRLAVSRIFFEENMPLILDDSFALYDDERLARTLRWLGERSGFTQILLFTCHHREAEILAKNGIPFTLYELD